MSKVATAGLEGAILHVFGLADAFIDVCPEDIWKKKFGGWPVWQQLYHGFSTVDFFLRPEGAEQAPALFDHAVGDLSSSPELPPTKAAMKEYVAKVQARVREYAAGLSDATLAEKNTGLSARFGKDLTHSFTLSIIPGHIFYHLGSCDAALRENGHKGVF